MLSVCVKMYESLLGGGEQEIDKRLEPFRWQLSAMLRTLRAAQVREAVAFEVFASSNQNHLPATKLVSALATKPRQHSNWRPLFLAGAN